ncbi:hypothetical protein [Pseudomonas peli]|uniref:hypothetical protein n=1 Tax=Pseudomonas peli TaxID=592361 RepID=UPI0024AC880B|nr:hypothetical protein [Pseudomonas peli]MDR7025569.1 hypothetical protein [Pseudomonas peli]
MKFSASEEYKKQEKRKTIYATIFVFALIAGFIFMLTNSDDLSNKVIAVIGIFFLAKHLPHAYRGLKNKDTSYPDVEILESQQKIEISHKGSVVSIPLADIESLRVQSIKGNVKSLLLTTRSFSNLRFEGYENLAKMAETLKKYTPVGKIKNATWYHR